MAKLPVVDSPTVEAIYKSYERQNATTTPRGHLGASQIGKECSRALWYSFRWVATPDFPGRLLRLFQSGHLQEPRLVADLRNIGVEVHDKDPSTGKQFWYATHGGHFGGSMDGALRGVREAPKSWAVAEFKTANEKSFKATSKHGVKKAQPKHYAQMQVYMGLADLRRAAYFMVNKNDDSIYFEWVHYDKDEFQRLTKKALRVVQAEAPLTRISDDESSFACRFCDFKPNCHEEKVADPNCRTCAHATPITIGTDAKWRCEKLEKYLRLEEQRKGCDEHVFIPALVPYAEAVDSGDGWVLYERTDDRQPFVNCTATSFPGMDVPHFNSRELSAVPKEAIGHPVVEEARRVFGGELSVPEPEEAA